MKDMLQDFHLAKIIIFLFIVLFIVLRLVGLFCKVSPCWIAPANSWDATVRSERDNTKVAATGEEGHE